MKRLFTGIVCLLISSFTLQAQVSNRTLKKKFKYEKVSSYDLEKWDFYGNGKGVRDVHKQFCLAEAEGSKGVVLVSPESYGKDVIVRYDAVPLTSSTVLVMMLATSDHDNKDGKLTIPDNYDGALSFWNNNVDGYFFAYHNLAHNYTPFVRRSPKVSKTFMAYAKENVMSPGKCSHVEIGKVGGKLWMKVDGKLLYSVEDKDPYQKGKIVFRTRGTLWFKASTLIKNVEIFSRD
jgi:hypothetical protein